MQRLDYGKLKNAFKFNRRINLHACHPFILPRIKARLTHEGKRESYSGVHVSARDAAGDDGAEGHSDGPAPIDREEFTEERVSVELTGEGDLRRGATVSVHWYSCFM